MSVVSSNIVYVNQSAFDLRKVSSVVYPADNPSVCLVRFIDTPDTTVTFDRASFDVAWQASLDSASAPVPLGGDLGGVTSNGYVLTVRGVSNSLTYSNGKLATLTTALGTKTFSYNPDGTLASITGTGNYHSKNFSYSGGVLTGVTVL